MTFVVVVVWLVWFFLSACVLKNAATDFLEARPGKDL